MRLTEQAKILKEEIRRLERNQQREEEAANLEYLKNILFKVSFCTFDSYGILKEVRGFCCSKFIFLFDPVFIVN